MTEIKERRERILKALKKELSPSKIQIKDNSEFHVGHGNIKEGDTETHFFIKIRSEKFTGLKKIDMHRLVYKVLEKELYEGLHAIELDLDA